MSEQTGQDARFGAWVQSLGPGGGDSLLHFVPTPRNSVELTHAHPSGLAQLLSGRRTRLSTLLRDPVQYTAARRTARAISSTVADVAEQRGIEVGYLASGLLTWRTLRAGGSDFHSAPVMLGHVSCARREGIDDEEFQLVERCLPNQALLRHLMHTFGVKVTTDQLLEAAYMTARFDPSGPIAVLREALADIPGLVVADRMVVSTFADVADPADPEVVSSDHPVIAALMNTVGDDTVRPGRRSRVGRSAATAQDSAEPVEDSDERLPDDEAEAGASATSAASAPSVGSAGETAQEAAEGEDTTGGEPTASGTEAPEPETAATLRDDVMMVPSDLRDPSDELMVLDADEDQYGVLELVSAGRSVTVTAPAGTGSTTLAVNAASRLAAAGKRVLVVAEREQSVQDFIGSMARVGLESLVVNMRRDTSPDTLRAGLVRAVLRNERAKTPDRNGNDSVLRDRRVSLVEHVRSLRSVRPRWDASPLQAMRELARVTSQVPAPATRVRLKRSVLDAMPRRGPVVEQLQRASDLGAFDAATRRSPWYGSRLSHRGEAEAAVTLVNGLTTDLPPLRQRLEAIAKATRIKPVKTFAQWGKTLRLLVDVRRSLDKFEPDVFDKEVDDLIAATASASWRRERGIEMSSVTRSRLRRVAKEYVRPGVHIEDLHAALMQVKAQREAWKVLATDHRYPSVPTGLEAVLKTYREVSARIEELERMLPAASDSNQPLSKLPLAALANTLSRLSEAEADLETLPERTILLRELGEQGLDELLEDFETRHVARDMIDAEVEQAWWQSVLEAMVSGDDFLAIQDGTSLSRIQREYGRADAKHVGEGADQVRSALARRWAGSIVDHRVGARDLRALMKIGDPDAAELASISPDLTGALVPVWVGAPLYLPSALPPKARFDVTIILDAESLSLVGGLSAIARSPQVLAIGDPYAGAPRPLNVSVDPGEVSQARTAPISTFAALQGVTPQRSLSNVHRNTDERLVAALAPQYPEGLNAVPLGSVGQTARSVVVDGAFATGGSAGASTTRAEVETVVDLVFRSLEEHPERSLAVVAGNGEHARAVAKAVAKELPHRPDAQAAMQRRDEPFVVTSAERVAGLRRDALIFTLGYGRTPHGRPVHDLGRLGTEAGARAVTATLSIGREDVTIVSAFGHDELDAGRLRHGSALIRRVLEALSRPGGIRSAVSASAPTTADPDTLLADLAERLRAWGLEVGLGVGQGIDLAVAPPEGSAAKPVAVVSDGSEDYAAASVRQRSRVRPTQLYLRGWNPVQVWTIDVFSDPASVARRIASKAGVLTPRGRHDATALDSAQPLSNLTSTPSPEDAGQQ